MEIKSRDDIRILHVYRELQRVFSIQRNRLSRRHMIWPYPNSFPSPARKLERRHAGRLSKRDNMLGGKGEGGGGGAKSYDGEKPGPL